MGTQLQRHQEPKPLATSQAEVPPLQAVPFPAWQAIRTRPCPQGHGSPVRVPAGIAAPRPAAAEPAPSRAGTHLCPAATRTSRPRSRDAGRCAETERRQPSPLGACSPGRKTGMGWKGDPRAGAGAKERAPVLRAQHPKPPPGPQQPQTGSEARGDGVLLQQNHAPRGSTDPAPPQARSELPAPAKARTRARLSALQSPRRGGPPGRCPPRRRGRPRPG